MDTNQKIQELSDKLIFNVERSYHHLNSKEMKATFIRMIHREDVFYLDLINSTSRDVLEQLEILKKLLDRYDALFEILNSSVQSDDKDSLLVGTQRIFSKRVYDIFQQIAFNIEPAQGSRLWLNAQ